MIETLLPQAMAYLTDLLLKNEEVQKFPKDFVSASMRWVRSWFLEDDPLTKAVVESNKSAGVEEAVLHDKLSELLKNPQFVEELRGQLAAYATHRPRQKNVVDGSTIEATGPVRIGDTGQIGEDSYDEKNVVKEGSTIKTGGDFRLGDG